jgi:hypothetical protein
METHIDVAGAVIEIALCWSVVDRAKRAGLGEVIDLSSFDWAQISGLFWND